MEDRNHATFDDRMASSLTVRDLIAIAFRQRRTVVCSFVVILLTVVPLVLLQPAEYEAQMKILVKRERVDPVVTPGASSQGQLWLGVTEEELNSEVELLKSHDLLAKVVEAIGLHEPKARMRSYFAQWLRRGANGGVQAEEVRIARAAEQLAAKLEVQPLRRSNIIQVRYASPDPPTSAAVLETLADHYLDKHLTVHRPFGAFAFFEHEAERYQAQLKLIRASLEESRDEAGVVSVQAEQASALERLANLEAIEQTTHVAIAETEERLRALKAQAASIPARTVTEVRTVSARLIEQLQSALTPLELKRTELLQVFKPTYGPVLEVEAQIEKLRTAIDAARRSPLVEEATNRDPTYDYLRTELAKNQSELAALRARASATARLLVAYRGRARRLEQLAVAHQTLQRDASQAEDNYLVYARKREEARISDALDAERIVNVAIAEEPTLPYEPSGPRRGLFLLIGTVLAGVVSVGLALVKDRLGPVVQTHLRAEGPPIGFAPSGDGRAAHRTLTNLFD